MSAGRTGSGHLIPAWTPPQLVGLQPRLAGRLVDAKDFAGDDATDGNLTRAAALDAARQRFGEAAGAELSGILASIDDGAELARVGTSIIGCDTEADFLARVRSR